MAVEEFWKTHFILNELCYIMLLGLLFHLRNSGYDPKAADAIGMDTMVTHWPNVKASESTPESLNLLISGVMNGLKMALVLI